MFGLGEMLSRSLGNKTCVYMNTMYQELYGRFFWTFIMNCVEDSSIIFRCGFVFPFFFPSDKKSWWVHGCLSGLLTLVVLCEAGWRLPV